MLQTHAWKHIYTHSSHIPPHPDLKALEQGVWSALLDRLADPDEDGRVHESVLLCLAELFTPATRQLASAAQVHLRLAAELLVKPDDLVDEEGASTLPCQLALHLMGPAGERAPGTLAIARILVALSEHLSASCHHELLDSEVMQALMVAVAKPVVRVTVLLRSCIVAAGPGAGGGCQC
eukprot:811362-Pelagomonas_calceolata.AAC.1